MCVCVCVCVCERERERASYSGTAGVSVGSDLTCELRVSGRLASLCLGGVSAVAGSKQP